MRWYRKSADQGYAAAQFNLAGMYYRGQGIPQDYVQAHMWLTLAAFTLSQTEAASAVKIRDIIAAKMTPAQILMAQELSREWKPTKQ